MDYRFRLGSIGNSSTASWSSDPTGMEGSSRCYAIGTYIFISAVL